MKVPVSTWEALKDITSSRLFSIIMALGLFVSMFAITQIVIIGEGTKKRIEDTLRGFGFGADSLVIFGSPGKLMGHRKSRQRTITFQDIELIRQFPWLKYVSPHQVGILFLISRGNIEERTWLIGAMPDYKDAMDVKLAEGRFFTRDEMESMKKVCVLGYKVYKDLFQGKDAVGGYIRIGNLFFKVVGVIAEKGHLGRFNVDDRVVVPITLTRKILLKTEYINSVKVVVKKNYSVEYASREIEELLRKTHHIKEGFPDDFSIITASYVVGFVNRSVREITKLLMRVLLISLLLSGLVVVNVMTAAVSEREKDIGIKRAVGASRMDIFYEYMQYSLFISIAGSGAGVFAGSIFGGLIGRFIPVYINYKPFLYAFFFGVVVGGLSGIYPAIKACNMDPVEVLRG